MKKIVFSIVFLILGIFTQGPSVWAQNQAEGRKLYAAYCTSCHGDKGKGDGMAAGSLPIKPKDQTDGATMNPLTDQFLGDVIAKGGGAVGRSSFMPAWGSSLNEKQVRDIVAYIRTLAIPPYK